MDTLKGIAVFLMIPLFATIGLLLIAGGGDGEFTGTSIARVEQPKDLVFEWLGQPDLRERWVEGLSESKGSGARDVEVGQKMTETVGLGADQRRVTVEVLEAEYGEQLTLRFTEPGRTMDVSYKLSPNQSAKRTRVDVTVTGKLDGWWPRLIEPILAGRITTHLDDDLVRLDERMRGTR